MKDMEMGATVDVVVGGVDVWVIELVNGIHTNQ